MSLAEISVPSLLLSFTSAGVALELGKDSRTFIALELFCSAADSVAAEPKSTLGLHSWGPK